MDQLKFENILFQKQPLGNLQCMIKKFFYCDSSVEKSESGDDDDDDDELFLWYG